MIKLIAQFEKYSGPTTTGEHKITFTFQKEHISDLFPHLKALQDQPYVSLTIEHMQNTADAQKILDDNNKSQHTILNKKIHALIDKIAEKENVNSDAIKKHIKEILIKEGKIKLSLKELTFEGQEETITRLEKILNESN